MEVVSSHAVGDAGHLIIAIHGEVGGIALSILP